MRVLVVDDEAPARRKLLRLLAEEPDVHVVGEADNGPDAVAAIEALTPDLVLLDVQMPGLDGFGVVEALECDPLPRVVFVTAYDQYALRAFEVHALDYLLKPFDGERFRQAFRRGRGQLERRAHGHVHKLSALLEELTRERRSLEEKLTAGRPQHMEWVMVRARGKIEFLRTAEVDWIEAEGNYVRLHAAKRGFLIREKISTLEERLDPDRFIRVHRSTIVNLDRVVELRPLPSGDCIILLRDGVELKLSRGYRQKLAERVGEYA